MINQIDIRKMTNTEFKNFTKGKFFTCKFLTKQNKEREYKSCRVDVKCDTKGGINTVEHKNHLVTVWLEENGERKYRTLNLERVTDFKCGGFKYGVE